MRICILHNNSTVFGDEIRKYNTLKSFSKGRYILLEKDRDIVYYNLIFDNKNFINEIIENILGLFEKLEKYNVYL